MEEINNQKNYLPIAIVVGALIVAGAIAIVGLGGKGAPEGAQVAPPNGDEPVVERKELTITDRDHILGADSALVTIIEYSDFQCPFCQKFHPTMKQVLSAYDGRVKWVYRHFPLSFHQNAQPAGEAAECAGEQDKFWEFADKLFENQADLGDELYTRLAGELSLDQDQFDVCVSERKYKDRVESDFNEGRKLGVNGTPASFVNGEFISGAVPYDTLKTAIDKALAE